MINKSTPISSGNVPAWMVTFADLMALMMTFFVLLYSFSRIDEEKYKSIVDSMAKGFDGVQWIKRRLIEDDIIGPEPGIIQSPAISASKQKKAEQELRAENQQQSPQTIKQITHNKILFTQLKKDLDKEISTGAVHVEYQNGKVVIRFPENVSFSSGSDQLVENFVPVIHRISKILKDTNSKIMIAGHTDDRPISTERFRSNWELSTSRAVSVAHRLLETRQINSKQLVVVGHADTKPLTENTSEEQRARNRRVEISIFKDEQL